MKLPNFTIAGFAKCGTTSLYHYLEEHPEVFLPKRKELHYFTYDKVLKFKNKGPKDAEMHKFHTGTFDEYKDQFKTVANEKAIGDISPTYALYGEALQYLRDTLGEKTKMIVVVRDPIKRAYSNYLHLIRENRETETFYDALQLERERQKKGFSNFWYYKFISSYYQHIKRLKDQFDNVLIVTFEEFMQHPEQGIKEIYQFLEIDDSFVPENIGTRFNPGGLYKKNILTSFIFERSKLNSFVKSVIPLNSRVKKIVHSITNKFKKETPPIDQKSEEFLIDYFKEDVFKLKNEFGVKTEHWSKGFQS